jgi:hypothetical protein
MENSLDGFSPVLFAPHGDIGQRTTQEKASKIIRFCNSLKREKLDYLAKMARMYFGRSKDSPAVKD